MALIRDSEFPIEAGNRKVHPWKVSLNTDLFIEGEAIMPRSFRAVTGACAFAALMTFSGYSGAAFADDTVKVALLDMSSIAGPGMGPGRMGWGPWGQDNQQKRGPGMMGPGGQRVGPGMMGPGWNWGGNSGAGWMAGHMMGPGMMGMGMMSVRVTKPSAKAGKIRFEVANYSASIVHELEVVAVDDVNAPLPYDYNTAKVKIDKAKSKGEVEDVAPATEKVLELTLPAGNYLLICNLPGHYAAGMAAPFAVTP